MFTGECRHACLVSIRNYIALKLLVDFSADDDGLVSIRNYIALKLFDFEHVDVESLVSIRNYIALKPKTDT